MVRTENLLLKAAKSQGYVLPLAVGNTPVPASLRWSSNEMVSDTRAYNHWPWPWQELDGDQQFAIECGVAGHCSRTALRTDGSAGLHEDPVAVLDFASLYPSVFIANNVCWSSLLPQGAHEGVAADVPHHRTPGTIGPNCRIPGAAERLDEIAGRDGPRTWRGSAIAFVKREVHEGLLPRVLRALLDQRRAVKRRIKELAEEAAAGGGAPSEEDAGLAAVLDARQLTIKLLANASYGNMGADTWSLCCKPLHEFCLRAGQHYCRLAAKLIEGEGAAHPTGGGRWPGALVIYANTDSAFVKLPGRTAAEAEAIGREMAAFVSAQLPPALTLEHERVLMPLLLDAHNKYAGAERPSGGGAPQLFQRGFEVRGDAPYLKIVRRGVLERLLCEGDRAAAVAHVEASARALLRGEVSADLLVEGGFVKRANQLDLMRMAGLGADQRVDAATRKADEDLRTQPAYAMAVRLLQESVVDGRPTRVFRLGEWVPYVHVSRSGGAKGAKQFENIASVEEVVTKARPVDLRLTWEKRLVPDLLGQLVEVSGKATKAAAESDRPKALGRVLTEGERRELRSGGASRVACSGVLACDGAWRLFGLTAPPADDSGKAGQSSALTSFFGKKQEAPSPPSAEAAAAAAALRDEVAALTERRRAIARASGARDDEEPLLLTNLAAPLALAKKRVEAVERRGA